MAEEYKRLCKTKQDSAYANIQYALLNNFTLKNRYYAQSLSELSHKLRLDEDDAIDTLLANSVADLNQHLWEPYPQITGTDMEIFKVYNKALCPCLSKNINRSVPYTELPDISKQCASKLIYDSSFVAEIKRTGGAKSINDLNALSNFILLYYFQNCAVVTNFLGITIYKYPIRIQYQKELSARKQEEAEMVLKLYSEKKWNELAEIFPSFKKYIPAMTKSTQAINQADVVAKIYYPFLKGYNAPLIISLSKKGMPMGKVEINFSAKSFTSKIVSVKYETTKDVELREAKEKLKREKRFGPEPPPPPPMEEIGN